MQQYSSQNLTSEPELDNYQEPITNAAVLDLQLQNQKLTRKVGELTGALDIMLKKAESGQFARGGGGADQQLQDQADQLQSHVVRLQNQLEAQNRSLIQSNGGNDGPRVMALQGVIREKTKGEKRLLAQIDLMKKEYEQVKTTMAMSSEVEALYAFKAEYQALERNNTELKNEVMALKRIKNLQGKDLQHQDQQKVDANNNFKSLSDELKFYKEKNRILTDDLKRETKNNNIYLLKIKQLQEMIQLLKEQNKRLKIKDQDANLFDGPFYNDNDMSSYVDNFDTMEQNAYSMRNSPTGGDNQGQIFTASVNDSPGQGGNSQKMTMVELERQNYILKKAKDSIQVKQINQKVRQERKVERLEKQIIFYQQTLVEKEKEIKIQQVKLREFMQKNMNQLPAKTFEQIEHIIESEAANKTTPTRKMADTYKKIRMQSRKQSVQLTGSDYEYNTKLSSIKQEQERYRAMIAGNKSLIHNDNTLLQGSRSSKMASGQNIDHLKPKGLRLDKLEKTKTRNNSGARSKTVQPGKISQTNDDYPINLESPGLPAKPARQFTNQANEKIPTERTPSHESGKMANIDYYQAQMNSAAPIQGDDGQLVKIVGARAEPNTEPNQTELLVHDVTPGPEDIDQANLDIQIRDQNEEGPSSQTKINRMEQSQELRSEEFIRLDDGSPIQSPGKGSEAAKEELGPETNEVINE